MDNLPKWPGASEIYSRAYRILEKMAQTHVTAAIVSKRGKVLKPGKVSDEMRNFIEALNGGDEEQVKGYVLKHFRWLKVA
jgi:hypothetical protein